MVLLKELKELFFTFAKIGAFTFGGGYAMLALIENICVEEKQWITHDEMMDITVIAESTPGPVAINCATYVGYKKMKLAGAVAATIGMVLPSFIIIYLISRFFDNFLEISVVANAFRGIKAAVGILIVDAAVKLFAKSILSPVQKGILAVSFFAMMAINIFSLNISSLVIMLASAVVGGAVFVISGEKKKDASVEVIDKDASNEKKEDPLIK